MNKNDISSISGQSNSNSDITNNDIQKEQKDASNNLIMNSLNASLNLNFEPKKEYIQEIPEKPVEKYKDENKIIEEENKNLNNEIAGFDETINQNEDIDEKINEATEQLNKLKT